MLSAAMLLRRASVLAFRRLRLQRAVLDILQLSLSWLTFYVSKAHKMLQAIWVSHSGTSLDVLATDDLLDSHFDLLAVDSHRYLRHFNDELRHMSGGQIGSYCCFEVVAQRRRESCARLRHDEKEDGFICVLRSSPPNAERIAEMIGEWCGFYYSVDLAAAEADAGGI